MPGWRELHVNRGTILVCLGLVAAACQPGERVGTAAATAKRTNATSRYYPIEVASASNTPMQVLDLGQGSSIVESIFWGRSWCCVAANAQPTRSKSRGSSRTCAEITGWSGICS
jgi:hypothetical protein